MAEKRQQGGVFQNQWLNPAPTQISPQTGPYEMGASQLDAFGRRYPTPGITPPASTYQRPVPHRGHTGQQHEAARAGEQSGMLGYASDFDRGAELESMDAPSLLDDESRAYFERMSNKPTAASRRNFDENIPGQHKQDGGLEMSFMGGMGPLMHDTSGGVGPMNPLSQRDQFYSEWANDPKRGMARAHTADALGTGANAMRLTPTPEPSPLELEGQIATRSLPDTGASLGDKAAYAGLQGASALGKGVKGGLGYGRSLINAALYGNRENMGADRKDFLQEGGKALGKGGKALGKGANFMQRLLFGSKPQAAGTPSQGGGLTPEQQAMRERGIADNPWTVGDDFTGDEWWDEQEYDPTNLERWDSTPPTQRTGYWGVR
jgi:hypothetical protein